MLTLAKLSVLFAFALSASALATPHVARSPHGHRAIAARLAAPAPAVGPYGDEVRVVKPKKMRKRGDTGRCKAKSSSTSEAPSSTAAPEPTTPVANVAASPSSSSTPPPPETTSSTKKAEPSTSSQAPAPQPTSDSGSSNSGSSNSGSGNSNSPSFLQGTQSGQITFYDIGLGACGVTNSGSDRIAAVSKDLFDAFPGWNGANPNNNPVCGKSITITYQGKSTTVTVEDRCEGCAITDLDLSPTSFADLAAESVGRLDGATWVWNN